MSFQSLKDTQWIWLMWPYVLPTKKFSGTSFMKLHTFQSHVIIENVWLFFFFFYVHFVAFLMRQGHQLLTVMRFVAGSFTGNYILLLNIKRLLFTRISCCVDVISGNKWESKHVKLRHKETKIQYNYPIIRVCCKYQPEILTSLPFKVKSKCGHNCNIIVLTE